MQWKKQAIPTKSNPMDSDGSNPTDSTKMATTDRDLSPRRSESPRRAAPTRASRPPARLSHALLRQGRPPARPPAPHHAVHGPHESVTASRRPVPPACLGTPHHAAARQRNHRSSSPQFTSTARRCSSPASPTRLTAPARPCAAPACLFALADHTSFLPAAVPGSIFDKPIID